MCKAYSSKAHLCGASSPQALSRPAYSYSFFSVCIMSFRKPSLTLQDDLSAYPLASPSNF